MLAQMHLQTLNSPGVICNITDVPSGNKYLFFISEIIIGVASGLPGKVVCS